MSYFLAQMEVKSFLNSVFLFFYSCKATGRSSCRNLKNRNGRKNLKRTAGLAPEINSNKRAPKNIFSDAQI